MRASIAFNSSWSCVSAAAKARSSSSVCLASSAARDLHVSSATSLSADAANVWLAAASCSGIQNVTAPRPAPRAPRPAPRCGHAPSDLEQLDQLRQQRQLFATIVVAPQLDLGRACARVDGIAQRIHHLVRLLPALALRLRH